MNGKVRDNLRYRNLVSIIIFLMLILAVRLFILTMIQNERWTEEAQSQNTKTLYTSAPRGNIYDRNGNLLAGNKQVFTVTFNASNMTSAEINEATLTMIRELEKNNDEYKDEFPIKVNGDRFYYSYDRELSAWLSRNGYAGDVTADRVFRQARAEYGIAADLDRYKAMEELEDKHNVYLPINVRNMKFIYQSQKDYFLSRFGFDTSEEITAEECFRELRAYYGIDEELSDVDARKIMVVRNKVTEGSFQRYLPITVATGISDASVIYFSEMGIPGVAIESATERYYPYGSLACHMIGYMGAISDSEYDYYVRERNYLVSDMVGKAGIEEALEEVLHGTPGYETIIVNSSGEKVSTLSSQEAKKGNDVYLTFDVELQKATEETLKNGIENHETARSGAAVILDVKTADVLAMASYPDFDLNMFADGISDKEWASVQPENPRDSFSPTPLYNNATMASAAPGSTFKPITAIAALQCGLDPTQEIEDKGFIQIAERRFGCSTYNESGATDGFENLEWGMGNSCNYYFACIATNKDWGTGESLGYFKDITIDDILNTAHAYGLGENTGIEIAETVRPSVSAETKLESYRVAVWEALYDKAYTYFPPEVYKDYDRLVENITKIADRIYDNPEYEELYRFIENETEVLPDQVEACTQMVKYNYFVISTWTTFDVFNVSIGQGDNNYTPIQVANYVATIGNNGYRNQVSLVYGIEGEGRTVKSTPLYTGSTPEELAEVIKGMRRVCSSGTLRDTFSDYPIPVAGKTGTSEYQAVKEPVDEVAYVKEHLEEFNEEAKTKITWKQIEKKIEELMKQDANLYPDPNNTVDEALVLLSNHKINQSLIDSKKDTYKDFSWMITLAPADDPEIAVVLFLPEGGYASESGDVMAELISNYFGLYRNEDTLSTYAATDNTGDNVLQ